MKLGLDRKLGIDRFLTSWRSAEDPGFGDFSVRINPNGSPQFFVYNGTKPIIRSRPWPWRSQMGLYKCTFVNDPDEKYCVCTVPDDSYLLRLIVDASLKELYHPREALKCIQIGLLCVQEDATGRPSMLAIVFMLSSETEIPSPKQPAFLFRKSDKFPDIALDVEDGQCSVNEVTITEFACR
jgi:hypothetical protein